MTKSHSFVYWKWRSNTLIKVSILPPRKFVEALFFLQTTFEGLRWPLQ